MFLLCLGIAAGSKDHHYVPAQSENFEIAASSAQKLVNDS